jgi:spectinomycin phosphotransferase
MLTKPDLQDEKILACLEADFGLRVVRLTFLPLGADMNTAVYRAIAADKVPYFVKLRSGPFDEITVCVPRFLSDQGIARIIPPLPTRNGELWADLNAFRLILYPFVEGQNAREVALTDRQWADFGAGLKAIHTVVLPGTLKRVVPQEDYTPRWRDTVRTFLARVVQDTFDEPVAVELAAFLMARRGEVLDLVGRSERLAGALQARAPDVVLCHSDPHASNVVVDAHDHLYIVDWDNPILAPKERDLMFIGGAQGFAGHTPEEEEALFYRGYGRTEIDPEALAYYRYERIVVDIAVYCEQLLSSNEGGEDREQALHYLASNFLPGGTIEIAYGSDHTVKDG